MCRRSCAVFCSLLACLPAIRARSVPENACGTHAERAREELFLHARSESARSRMQARTSAAARRRAMIASAAATSRDYGNIAVMTDADGVVAHPNSFNLDGSTVRFNPTSAAAAAYRIQVAPAAFDADASANGAPLPLGDDDSRPVSLPFAFPFYGKTYTSMFVNSDGNATFGESDGASTERSLGRVTAGPPRIAPLFADLDPRGGAVRVLAEPSRVIVTWDGVPTFASAGQGAKQTLQMRLFPDGGIEFVYGGVNALSSVVGIAPGSLKGNSAVVHFTDGPPQEFAGAVAERFTGTSAVDMATVAQKFYATHDDAYDYLVAYNALGVSASDGAVAYEVTVRDNGTGYGSAQIDSGAQYGSPRRLRSIINMGPLNQYPSSPTDWVAGRGSTHDTPVTVLAHEAGHLFLAFASVPDPNNATGRPMLNARNLAHWAFTFNSDASLLEGNRIRDNGEGADPRFTTTATVQGYSALDQYLMGLRAPEEVDDTFVVLNAGVPTSKLPEANYRFSGDRLNVSVNDIVQAVGRRTPDHTVAQRRFRFAFVLIVPDGQEPSAADLEKVEKFRAEFEPFYSTATSGRATADASLRKAVQFSAAPAFGLIAGSTGRATVSIAQPAPSPLTFTVSSATGAATAASVVIAAGASTATLAVSGARAGTDTLTLVPDDSSFETVTAQVQVLESASALSLNVVSGDRQVAAGGPLPQPVAIRVVDRNQLPYPGVSVSASVSDGGLLDEPSAVTDENGVARFRWTPALGSFNEFIAAIPGAAAQIRVVALSKPAVLPGGIGNAASYAEAVTPGGIAAVFGSSLAGGAAEGAQSVPLPYSIAGVQVFVNDAPVQLYYVSDGQVNIVLPQTVQPGVATVTVASPVGAAQASVNVAAVQPGLFFNPANGFGAILIGNTDVTTDMQPAAAGDILSIYGTGLGLTQARADGLEWTLAATRVEIDGRPAEVQYSGLAPAWPGLYQVNAKVPDGIAAGVKKIRIVVNGVASNDVTVALK